MEKFISHTGTGVPLRRSNVDTDQIIPAAHLVYKLDDPEEKKNYGRYAFSGVPIERSGLPQGNIPFINEGNWKSGYTIVIGGKNFGCGSSREHAPWALADFGFRVLIAPSFADIFYNNCFKNGLLPIVLDSATVDHLFKECSPGYNLIVDLADQTIVTHFGETIRFDIDPTRKHRLLNGLDDIDLTLQHAEAIKAFEAKRAAQVPWLFTAPR